MPKISQRGLTLVELMVAMTIVLVGMQAALLLYDASWKSYKKGENAAEQQQAVRIAFDHLGHSVLMAGLNYNPDGDDERPDEQIEAAFDTAIVIRADFDGQDATAAATPEGTLDNGGFDIVSTGNDEIVTYVLAKPDGTGGQSLVFEADVANATRDGVVETITIPNVALIQDDPPYNLYRITLNNDETTYGTADFFTRTLVAENIRSMTFRYFDSSGTQLNSAFDLTQSSDDIGGAEADVADREEIRQIEIDLEGLTRDPDPMWVDPGDSDAETRSYKKFSLKGDFMPRNLGKTGLIDLPSL